MIVDMGRKLLVSRKFMTAILTIVFNILVTLIPGLEHVVPELMTVSVVVWVVLAGTWGIEDAAEKGREIAAEGRETNDEAIRRIVDEILEARKNE